MMRRYKNNLPAYEFKQDRGGFQRLAGILWPITLVVQCVIRPHAVYRSYKKLK